MLTGDSAAKRAADVETLKALPGVMSGALCMPDVRSCIQIARSEIPSSVAKALPRVIEASEHLPTYKRMDTCHRGITASRTDAG